MIRTVTFALLGTSVIFAQSVRTLERELVLAHQAEMSKDFSKAESIYEALLKEHPAPDIAQRLGLVRQLQNKFSDAADAFSAALRLDPKRWTPHLFLGIDLYRMNRFHESLAHLKTADRLNPGVTETRFWIGATQIALHQNLAGLETLEEVLTKDPHNTDVLRLLAETYADYGTAIQNEVADKYPDSAAAAMIEGRAFEFEGSYREALQAFRKAASKDPELPSVRDAIAEAERHVQASGR